MSLFHSSGERAFRLLLHTRRFYFLLSRKERASLIQDLQESFRLVLHKRSYCFVKGKKERPSLCNHNRALVTSLEVKRTDLS